MRQLRPLGERLREINRLIAEQKTRQALEEAAARRIERSKLRQAKLRKAKRKLALLTAAQLAHSLTILYRR